MNNERINSRFKNDKWKAIREYENKIDYISSQHYTNYSI